MSRYFRFVPHWALPELPFNEKMQQCNDRFIRFITTFLCNHGNKSDRFCYKYFTGFESNADLCNAKVGNFFEIRSKNISFVQISDS